MNEQATKPDAPVALITGAGRGIGRAIAAELFRRGYRLVLVSRSEVDLHATAATIQAPRDATLIAPADVARAGDLERVVAATIARFGRVDAVVHNAGYGPVLSIEQTTADEWSRVINTNLTAAATLARLAWPIFKRQGGGVLVNISSLAAVDPFPGFAAYGAAKAGLHTLGIALAREGDADGIRVHTIAPGAVETEMFRTLRTPEQWPRSKCLEPSEVADVVGLCVAGDLRYASGQVIYLRKTAT